MQRSVLCFIHGRGDQWEAICVDFDLAVSARSFEEARDFLLRAIRMYVEGAMAEEPSVREKLLNRRAPLWLRLSYVARHMLSLMTGRGAGEARFRLPCPV